VTVEASAPAKLVLLGEYAVLEGAPALAVATAQRAQVRIGSAGSGDSRLRARPLSTRELRFRWSAEGRLEWRGDLQSGERRRLAWLAELLEALARLGWWPAGAVALEVDTRAFHADDGTKLGLGSSAALTVALAGAGCRAAQGNLDGLTLARVVALHRALQGGRGSGVDVAASLLGGVVVYRLTEGGPLAQATALPQGLHLLALASGDSFSTPAALDRLAAWARDDAGQWARLLRRLRDGAERGSRAVDERDATALEQALAEFGGCLAELGRASGIDIFGPGHARVGRLAEARGVTYKPSGAGGDLGIAASVCPRRLASLRHAAAGHDIRSLDIGGEAPGLRVCPRANDGASR